MHTQPIAFGVSFLHSQISIDNLVLYIYIYKISRSLVPRSVEKRPSHLRLEIEIKWHSKCINCTRNAFNWRIQRIKSLSHSSKLGHVTVWQKTRAHSTTRPKMNQSASARCYRISPTPTWCVKLHIHVYVCVHIFVYMYIYVHHTHCHRTPPMPPRCAILYVLYTHICKYACVNKYV